MYNGIKPLVYVWRIIVALLTISVSVVIPLELSFKSFLFEMGPLKKLAGIVFILDFIFFAVKEKKYRRGEGDWKISNKSWFRSSLLFSDFVAAVPFEILFPLPVFQLFRLFKLIRLFTEINVIQRSVIRFASLVLFVSFAFWFLLIINGLACGWNLLELKNFNTDFATDYINALYWTITTLTTVGYGDIIPVNNHQKIYAIFVQVLGFGVFTFIIGTVASRLMRKDPARERYEENMESLAALVHYKSLPWDLRIRIIDFYKYMWRQRLGYDESTFLQTLPNNLQIEVALHLKRDVIDKVSIFKNAPDSFKREIALLLKPIFLTPGDYIFKAGDIGHEMYFVVEGELDTLTLREDRELTKLKAGDFFGEIALFKNQNRSATVKALTFCDVYTLDKASFDRVIPRYPKIVDEIRITCEHRENQYSS